MNTQNALTGLLAVQVALAALTWWPSSDTTAEARKLIEGGGNTITHLAITRSGEAAEPVILDAKDGKWAITSAHGYPADADKVAEVVDALAGIQLGEPVATSAASHAQLKVGDADFGKKITFTADGKEHTLHLGAAASKAVYLRVDGGEEVYKVNGFSEFTFKDTSRSYWATNYVQFDKDAVTTFRLIRGDWLLSFSIIDGEWSLGQAPQNVKVRKDKLEELIAKASALRLSEPVGTEMKPEYDMGPGSTHVEWTVTQDETQTNGMITIGKEVDGKHYVQEEGNPFIVFVPSYVVKPLLEATQESLTELVDAPPLPATEATP